MAGVERPRVATSSVGVRNYLVEGVSGTGKTSVWEELNDAATTPLTVTENWPIKAILLLVRPRGRHRTNTTSGTWAAWRP